MREVTAIIIGAGDRGLGYAEFGVKNPGQMKIVGVAEPRKDRREKVAAWYNIPEDMCFDDYNPLLAKGKVADMAIIATQDNMHYDPTMRAIDLGYDILLEKPIAPTLDECIEIAKAADDKGVIFSLCYVLRYTQFYRKIKEIIDSGKIGRLINIQHIENIGFWHYVHAFVRGHWRNSEESCPMILAKCCHDMDILNYLVGANPAKVSSFGDLTYFKEENAPAGSTDRCTDNCELRDGCPYSAARLYLREENPENVGWPADVVTPDKTLEGRIKALETGRYGKCAWRSDNNVADNQVCVMNYENGVNVSFTASAFSRHISRETKVMGSHGEIVGHLGEDGAIIDLSEFKQFNFAGAVGAQAAKERVMSIRVEDMHGHGGGDMVLMKDFVDLVRDRDPALISAAKNTIMSHVLAFAAEKSRLENRVVNIDEYDI